MRSRRCLGRCTRMERRLGNRSWPYKLRCSSRSQLLESNPLGRQEQQVRSRHHLGRLGQSRPVEHKCCGRGRRQGRRSSHRLRRKLQFRCSRRQLHRSSSLLGTCRRRYKVVEHRCFARRTQIPFRRTRRHQERHRRRSKNLHKRRFARRRSFRSGKKHQRYKRRCFLRERS